ncbi:MAG: hypothetical protein WDZ70_02520 [Candidatus Paceibacterota bacterium]
MKNNTSTSVDLSGDPYLPSKDWEILEHRGEGIIQIERCAEHLCIDGKKVELFLLNKQKDEIIVGSDLQEIIQDQSVLSANVLDYLIEHQELIPESWREVFPFFWGTIYRYPDGRSGVRCLRWRGDHWDWSRTWLGCSQLSSYPAVVLAD